MDFTVSISDFWHISHFQVLDDSRNWWKVKNHQGQIGYAPYTILKEYTPSSEFDADKVR